MRPVCTDRCLVGNSCVNQTDYARRDVTITFVEEYRTADKTTWGPGPWQDEPDKAVWVDEATDFDCMLVRNPGGALCGYVGVPGGHPFHGVDYNTCLDHGTDCEERWEHRSPDSVVSVHGGLTFAAGCAKTDDPAKHVCHILQTGRPEEVWWFGFDCSHYRDLDPRRVADDRKRYEDAKAAGDTEGMRIWSHIDPDVAYRDVRYVTREVGRMAEQLAAVSA